MANHVSTFHILGRYPELAQNKAFIKWLRTYGAQVWHETLPTEQGHVTVVVQSSARLNLFAALLLRDTSHLDRGILAHKIVRTAEIDLVQHGLAPSLAVALARKETGITNNNQIHALRPVVNFSSKEPSVEWDVEVNDGKTIRHFKADALGQISSLNRAVLKPLKQLKPPADDLIPPSSDELEENECHHLATWRATAQQMVGNATTPNDRAFAIWLGVRQRMLYDATITHISEFTWSDNLVINQNAWKGICDEWAVVQITLLRSLGIPAVMKFLIWQQGSQGVGHACLEWSDNGTWRHMDALWSAFDNRARYRQSGATNVTVMDGSSPMDSRYTGLAWGVIDVSGDQKFYPYGDFIINPAYPGNQRPGYSY